MIDLDTLEIKDFICNETSSFALSIVDIQTAEVIYTNHTMRDFLINEKATKCWESMYGKSEQCSWCGLKNTLNKKSTSSEPLSNQFEYEYFNEKTNKWYQIQNRATQLKNGQNILLSLAIDISIQKEAQGHLITTQVKLVQQADELKEAQKELKHLASIDSMTKLYNRRSFFKLSSPIMDLSKRNHSPISIIMLDIDNFKNINDTYGHAVGDETIISIAKKLQEVCRKSDVLSRWGGEEFVILLPDTNLEGALAISEKIRVSIQNNTIVLQEDTKLNFTASIGVSQVNHQNDVNIESAISRADEALYRAKRGGKNRVLSN